jgi:hypothetical protein
MYGGLDGKGRVCGVRELRGWGRVCMRDRVFTS